MTFEEVTREAVIADTKLLNRIKEVYRNKNQKVMELMNDTTLTFEAAKEQIKKQEELFRLEVEALLDGRID